MAMAIQIAFTPNQAEQEAPKAAPIAKTRIINPQCMLLYFIAGSLLIWVQAEIFGRTSHISDAHGCCTWNTAEFAEGIDLHGTGERKHDVRDHIEGRFIRQKSGDPENQDFYDQNNLPPMDLTLVL